jgi:hypothetical protein
MATPIIKFAGILLNRINQRWLLKQKKHNRGSGAWAVRSDGF